MDQVQSDPQAACIIGDVTRPDYAQRLCDTLAGRAEIRVLSASDTAISVQLADGQTLGSSRWDAGLDQTFYDAFAARIVSMEGRE